MIAILVSFFINNLSLEIYLGDKNILYLCNWLIQCVEASKTLLMRNDHLIFDEDLLRMKDSQSMEIQKRLFVIECIEVVLAILSSQISTTLFY